jgi:membrane protease YdiL (CAAX protease family)
MTEPVVAEAGNSPRSDWRRNMVFATVVVGAVLIGATLRLPRASAGFYVVGFVLAAVWVVASLIHGSIPWWGDAMSRPAQIGLGVLFGGLTFGVFVVGAVVGRHISFLAGPIDNVLSKADAGPVVAVLTLALVNGVAEELFFRGVLVDAIGDRWTWTIALVVYIAVTAVGGNTALAVAALVMGVVFVGERAVTRGIAASIVTHVVWSTLIILFLPR